MTGVFGRYGNLVSSEGTSKISYISNIIYHLLGSLGNKNITLIALTSWIGLALSISWIIYVFSRSLSVKKINDIIKITLEAYLFYITFVALPAYAQYVITPVFLLGLLISGNWHRLAAIITSIAFLWDQFFIVYMPDKPMVWENYFHQISHLTVIIVVLFFVSTQFFSFMNHRFNFLNRFSKPS